MNVYLIMKKHIFIALVALLCSISAAAQTIQEGTINKCIKWTFDGQTLTINNLDPKVPEMAIPNYDNVISQAPWIKKKLARNIKRVNIGVGISRIGSCAFANCTGLTDLVFENPDYCTSIGWGAFMNCPSLHNVSFPPSLIHIETIAFANCTAISTIRIPDQCRVEDQAFVNCTNVKSVDISPTATIGSYVFAKEDEVDGVLRHSLYNGEIRRLPSYINIANCHEYGLAPDAVSNFYSKNRQYAEMDYDAITSAVDSVIPTASITRNDIYALIIGNQNYRFSSDVPYAIHDARVFAKYCEQTLGIPVNNIHLCEDATKTMIWEEELNWLEKDIEDQKNKRLIVYYAGHGVPDSKDKNKSYILPTDVRGTNPRFGIALSDFYNRISEIGFAQTSVFVDACFSGVNRDNEGVDNGLRGVVIEQEQVDVANPSLFVFSAAQGYETAQGYTDQGHGLFTYFLLKGLQEGRGYTSFGKLSDDVIYNVRSTAPTLRLRKEQTPTTTAADGINWRSWTF